MEGRRTGRRGLVFATVVVTCLIGLAAAPTVTAGDSDHATFVGTSYTNEHFVMDIASTGAVIYSLERTETLVERVYWIVEERVDGTWTPLSWTGEPSVSEEDAGPSDEFHRVTIRGIVGDRMAVGILFDGKAIDVPSMGPKISVDIQAIEGPGEFRLAWYFSGLSASALLFESRVGEIRSPVWGPVPIPAEFHRIAGGENSVVALAADLSAVRFGINWDDALASYQSTEATMADGDMVLRIQFGDFPLDAGERFVLDPIIEGGGGGGDEELPTVIIGNVEVDREPLASSDRATVTWTTTPTASCDTFDWGTTASYGNRIQLSCGSHSVTVWDLSYETTYYYRITSSHPDWYTDTNSGSIHPVDTDGDGIPDGVEVQPRSLTLTVNGVSQTRTVTTLPYAADTDGDGLGDKAEWTGITPAGVVTDPSDWDTDDDGLGDLELWTVHTIRGLPQLDSVLSAIEDQRPLKYWEPIIRDYITLYTEYVAIANPLSSDTDGDGLSDPVEFFLHSDPRNGDTDQDRLPDGADDDPTTVELERPLIFIDAIWCCYYYQDWQLKRYRITYSVYDTAGLDRAVIYKDNNYGSPIQTHYLNGATSGQYTDNFDVGWGDAFDGAKWEIYAVDLSGNVDYITLQQPTLFDAIGNFLTSATVTGLGPSDGGKLSGGWYALRDTVVDLATLFLNPGAIMDGGRAVGDAFQSQGIGALVDLGMALYGFIDETQEEANPYASGTWEHTTFRYNWYAGYIAATIGLSLVGATAAKAVVQGLKASTVLSKVSGALGDLADATKVAQYVNRLKGIGIVNSRILVGAVFTTAFAGAAYLWPEIFGAWFSNYMGGAFVFVSLYSLGPFGFADDVLKKAPRVVTKAGLNDVDGFVKRLHGKFGKEVTERTIRELDGLGGLPGYKRLVRNIDTANNLGFVHEARVAAHHGAANIEELERKVSVMVDGKLESTDLDILLRNGDIIEAKFRDLSGAYFGSPDYADFVKDLDKQLKIFQAWRASTSRSGANIVAFRITPHPDILKWLSDHGFGTEVVP